MRSRDQFFRSKNELDAEDEDDEERRADEREGGRKWMAKQKGRRKRVGVYVPAYYEEERGGKTERERKGR